MARISYSGEDGYGFFDHEFVTKIWDLLLKHQQLICPVAFDLDKKRIGLVFLFR